MSEVTPPPIPTPAIPTAAIAMPQLSPEHFAQLQAAGREMKKIRRVITTANVDGWSVGAFGALTAVFGLTDIPSLALGLVMVGVAFVELRAAKRVRRLDPSAPKTLGWNQVVLGGSLMIYAAIRLFAAVHGESEYASMVASEPELGQMLGPIDGLTRQITGAVYVCVMLIAVFGQGGMALYYFTRGRYIRAYVASTPVWVIEMQKAGVSV